MMQRSKKTIHEEAKSQSEKLTNNVNVYGPFSSGINPRTKSRVLHRRNGKWMVRCSGYWCELTGVKVQLENPRVVVFDTEARNSYK